MQEEGEEEGSGAVVPSPGDEGPGEEEPMSRPGKQAKNPDAAMQTSTSVDEESHACEARVSVGLGSPKLLMLKLVEQVAAETVVKATPGDSLLCCSDICLTRTSSAFCTGQQCGSHAAPLISRSSCGDGDSSEVASS